jgi:hypothetical protein
VTIKKHHIAITVLIVVGAAYLWHMWNQHGTFKQTLSGIGINR